MAVEVSRVRRALRNVTWLRSFYHFSRALIVATGDTRRHSRETLDQLHSTSVDIWQYSILNKSGKDRFTRESLMLDGVREGQAFPRALEIGCHEGAFTEYLASRCSSVLAVDFSPLA